MSDGVTRPVVTGAVAPPPASCLALFMAFNRMALQGFGGVLPVAQRELVERLGWLTREQFLEMFSVAQVLPGPNVVNLSLMVGDRFFGTRGAFAALAGMLAAPLVIVLAVAALHAQWASHPVVAGALRGMGAVAAGLVLATALKLGGALRHSPLGRPACALAVLATLAASGLARWPLLAVVGAVGGSAMAWAWWRTRERRHG